MSQTHNRLILFTAPSLTHYIHDFDVIPNLQRIFKRTALSVNAGAHCRWVPRRVVDLLMVDGIGERLSFRSLADFECVTAMIFFFTARACYLKQSPNELLSRKTFYARRSFVRIRPKSTLYFQTNMDKNHLYYEQTRARYQKVPMFCILLQVFIILFYLFLFLTNFQKITFLVKNPVVEDGVNWSLFYKTIYLKIEDIFC